MLSPGHHFRGSGGNQPSAAVTAFRTQVYHIIRGLYHVEIMLDDQDRIALIYQGMKHPQKLVDIGKV
jgi:hypothetical protein